MGERPNFNPDAQQTSGKRNKALEGFKKVGRVIKDVALGAFELNAKASGSNVESTKTELAMRREHKTAEAERETRAARVAAHKRGKETFNKSPEAGKEFNEGEEWWERETEEAMKETASRASESERKEKKREAA